MAKEEVDVNMEDEDDEYEYDYQEEVEEGDAAAMTPRNDEAICPLCFLPLESLSALANDWSSCDHQVCLPCLESYVLDQLWKGRKADRVCCPVSICVGHVKEQIALRFIDSRVQQHWLNNYELMYIYSFMDDPIQFLRLSQTCRSIRKQIDMCWDYVEMDYQQQGRPRTAHGRTSKERMIRQALILSYATKMENMSMVGACPKLSIGPLHNPDYFEFLVRIHQDGACWEGFVAHRPTTKATTRLMTHALESVAVGNISLWPANREEVRETYFTVVAIRKDCIDQPVLVLSTSFLPLTLSPHRTRDSLPIGTRPVRTDGTLQDGDIYKSIGGTLIPLGGNGKSGLAVELFGNFGRGCDHMGPCPSYCSGRHWT